tara:strand:- start:146 stop:580 length:435 start_codon:yes stop_codon:yes gene_type:complete
VGAVKAQKGTLTEKQVHAARLQASGMIMREISAEVGVSRRQLYRWRDVPAYSLLVRQLKTDTARAARDTLESGARKAARRILELVDSSDEKVALAAATTLLDRTGHPKTERREIMQAIAARVVTGPADAVADLDAAMAGGGADE